jgi:hypothetical protein
MGSAEAVLGCWEEVEAMGPAMHGAAEVLNDWILLWMAVSAGVLLGAIALALVRGELLRLMRCRRSSGEACRAFADAASRGDLEAAEDMAILAFARNVRGGRVNEATEVRGAGIRVAGRGIEMTGVGFRDDHP